MKDLKRDVKDVKLTPVQELIRKWSRSCGIEAHDGQWDYLNELISAIVQTERDRADADLKAAYAGGQRLKEVWGVQFKAFRASEEALRTRAEKAEAERDTAIRQLGQTAAECGRAEGALAAKLWKAERDLAEAVEGLTPFADQRGKKVSLFRSDEFYNFVQAGHFRRAAAIVAKHTPPGGT